MLCKSVPDFQLCMLDLICNYPGYNGFESQDVVL